MAKHIYLYSSIYSESIQRIAESLDTIEDTEDVKFRINSGGGEVNAGFSFLSRISERTGKNEAIIDGQAKSMAAFWLPFFNHVTANDTSEIMFHKAAYPSWYEPTAEEQESLDRTNALFEEKMRAKVNGKPGAEKFLKRLFDKEKRNDVEITAGEAKKLGIVNEVRKLQPTAYEGMQIVAMIEHTEPKKESNQVTNNNNNNSMGITQDELNARLAEARKEGAKAENKRCRAWAKFATIAPEKVKEAIENTESEFDVEAMAEMAMLKISATKAADHKEDNEAGVNTDANADAETAEKIKKEAEAKEIAEALAKEGITIKA